MSVPPPPRPVASPSTTPTVAPVFTSNNSAVAAATSAFDAYLRQIDAIFSAVAADPELMRSVASTTFAEEIIVFANRAREYGIHSEGHETFDGVSVVGIDEIAEGGVGVLVVDLCLDRSTSIFVDATGAVLEGPVDDPTRKNYVVSFDWKDPTNPGSVIVGSQTPLPGGTACG
ncbi:hypothetical protein E3T55_06310 [Cryobacterium frigoriphilum]|uniref:Nuclear transport factor 2 family protein n=1 Tax=Cryobacterium frigoriphilum TaxID=1259150 RepID=A0A4R9A568_9MICO|nr:hypothetical protein [Cryobacterium frigoriphilum]TFD52220.1 hypothetical protein E3T55_06310 [Cryobacterium frigoriphilum]